MRGSLLAGSLCGLFAIMTLNAEASFAETLDWVTYKPKGANDPQAVTTQWFADELERRTGGEYRIRIHWGGSIANMGEVPTALENGLGDIGDVVTPIFPDQLLINNAISYFWPQPNSPIELGLLMEYWYQTVPQFSEELSKYNLKKVGLRPLEAYGMLCTRPVRSVADMKGLRIRAYGFALPAIVNALGGVPLSMTTADTYEALQRNMIDCAPVGPTLAAGWKLDEVAKYYVELPLGASWGHIIAMNLDSYNALPKDVQEHIENIGREYLVRFTVEMLKQENEVRQKWRDTGTVEVIPFSRDEFISVVADDPGIKQVQNDWVTRAKASGVATEQIVPWLTFD